jgi:flagellar biosynthesis protein FliR
VLSAAAAALLSLLLLLLLLLLMLLVWLHLVMVMGLYSSKKSYKRTMCVLANQALRTEATSVSYCPSAQLVR